MSAEILRRAASLMRERAEAVEPLGVWIEDDWRPDPATPLINYTASWHPAVALAVADWLESLARRSRLSAILAPTPNSKEWQHGNAVARAYLGGDA